MHAERALENQKKKKTRVLCVYNVNERAKGVGMMIWILNKKKMMMTL